MANNDSKSSLEVPFSFMVNLEVISNGSGFLYVVRDFRNGMPLKITDDVSSVAPFVLQVAKDFQAINTRKPVVGQM